MGLKKCVGCKQPFEWEDHTQCPDCGWDKSEWKDAWQKGVESALHHPSSLDEGVSEYYNTLLKEARSLDSESLSSATMILLQDLFETTQSNTNLAFSPELKSIYDSVVTQNHPLHTHGTTSALQQHNLPSGYINPSGTATPDFSPFAEGANQHEWLIYPGEDVLEMSAEGFRQIICTSRDTVIRRSNKAGVPAGAVEVAMLSALLGYAIPQFAAPFAAVLVVGIRRDAVDLNKLCK